jgi:transcription antitermination factor NusG
MDGKLLVGLWRAMIPVPRPLWRGMIMKEVRKTEKRLGFMTPEHRTVHHFVVRELPRVGRPVSPEFVSQGVGLPVERVNAILDELEAAMTFLFRNEEKAVIWAYPVTADETPHLVAFSTGEQVHAA